MSIQPERANFNIWRGATFRKRLTLTVDGEPRDFTDYTAELIIRDEAEGDPLLTLTTENSRITLGDDNGQIDLVISAEDTADISWDIGVYDFTVTAPGVDGDTDALLFGTFRVSGI